MPYKFETDKVKLPEGKDRRIKLTAEDKEAIKALYSTGNISTYKLAEEFNVSRRTIQFILDPSKKKAKKPIKLMDRIRDLYTNEGDIVADFFMGSGSMGESAITGNRKFIGCDIGDRAFEITNNRLKITLDKYL